jgi:hypothetical protein
MYIYNAISKSFLIVGLNAGYNLKIHKEILLWKHHL